MAVTNWIIDKSAYTRLSASRDATTWIERIERGHLPEDLLDDLAGRRLWNRNIPQLEVPRLTVRDELK